MSLWNHPRLTAALCTVAVLGCAAAPAVFLAAADAASLGRVETAGRHVRWVGRGALKTGLGEAVAEGFYVDSPIFRRIGVGDVLRDGRLSDG